MSIKEDMVALREALSKGPTRGEWVIDEWPDFTITIKTHDGDKLKRRAIGQFVLAAHPDRIERLLDAAEKMRVALEFYTHKIFDEKIHNTEFGMFLSRNVASTTLKELGLE